MMDKSKIENTHHQTFENIKQLANDGSEFWMARKLGKILDYAEFRNFLPVITKAMKACSNSGQTVTDHFVEMHELIEIGKGGSFRSTMKKNGLLCG